MWDDVVCAAQRGLPPAAGSSVCLITPPSAFLLDERVFVSLGVLKVAASLEAAGYEVNLLDLSGVENFLSPLADYLSTSRDIACSPAPSVRPRATSDSIAHRVSPRALL